MATYIALIHKDADSDYGVSFPDLPGCVTAGASIHEAISMAKEALAFHIEGMLESDEDIPMPTDADKVSRDDALLIAAIDVPDELKVERVNITIPAITLARIDSFAQQRGMTRSGLLVEAFQRWVVEEQSLSRETGTWQHARTHQVSKLLASLPWSKTDEDFWKRLVAKLGKARELAKQSESQESDDLRIIEQFLQDVTQKERSAQGKK